MSLLNGFYLRGLEQYLRLIDDLNHVAMSPKRRGVLETTKKALEAVLDMYEVDYR